MRGIARQTLERVFRSEKGSVLAMTAMAMPAMLGAAGLATDSVQWMLWQRQLQQQADSAVIAGAHAYGRGTAAEATIATEEALLIDTEENASFDRSTKTVSAVPVTVTEGGITFVRKEVSVGLSMRRALPFSGLFMKTPPLIRAAARAGVVQIEEFCLITLGEKTPSKPGIRASGSANVTLGCGMATNASGASAISGGNNPNAKVKVSSLSAVGEITGSDKFITTSPPTSFGLKQLDPFAGKTIPCSSPCTPRSVPKKPASGVNVLLPGRYPDLDLDGATYQLQSGGTYWIDGDVKINSKAVLTGTNVTIVLSPTSSIDVNGSATVDLTAPTTGPNANILFFQPKQTGANPQVSKFNGGGKISMTGAMYLPNGEVQVNGGADSKSTCLLLVADTVEFGGGANWENSCPTDFPLLGGAQVRLLS